MSQETTPSNNLAWDPNDPHGINPDEAHGGHSHFVADWRMQVGVLTILLLLTLVTVGFYNLEQWIEVSFQISLPKWVNVVGVMSVAVVKATLVAAFFMQLKYDKALNTFVLLFCLFCVGLFLTFSMIDLKSRDWVEPFKAESLSVGGTGVGLNAAPADAEFSVELSPKVNTGGMPIYDYARLNGNKNEHGLLYYRERNDEATFWEHFYAGHATHRDALDEHNFFEQLGFGHKNPPSSANASHPRHGITPGLFSDVAPSKSSAGHSTESQGTESQGNGH